jgi:SHS family lactate transporter-like MFS transporter
VISGFFCTRLHLTILFFPFSLYAVPKLDKWEALFWIGAGLTTFAALVRLVLPESHIFLRAKAEREANGESTEGSGKVFIKSIGQALKQYWGRCIFAVLLMSFFNFYSHSSQGGFKAFEGAITSY